MSLQLAQPVADLHDGGTWPVHVQAQGQLQNWPGRLAAWVPMKDWQLSGAYSIDVGATASMDRIDLRQATLRAEPLVVGCSWLNVNEPRVELAAAGSWNQQQRRLQIDPASLTCADLGGPGQQRRYGHADQWTDGSGRHAQLSGRRGPAAAMAHCAGQADHLATGRATPRHIAVARRFRLDPRRHDHGSAQPDGHRCDGPAVPGAEYPPDSPRRLQSSDRRSATRAVRGHLQRAQCQSGRPNGPSERRQQRTIRRADRLRHGTPKRAGTAVAGLGHLHDGTQLVGGLLPRAVRTGNQPGGRRRAAGIRSTSTAPS